MRDDGLLLLGRPQPQPPVGFLRGQFVIRGAYPYGPKPGSASNPFFVDEIDTVYSADGPAAAERIMRDYVARGANHNCSGSVSGGSYGGQYPFTRWIDRPGEYADFLDWQAQFTPVHTHFVLADNFFDDFARTGNFEPIKREYQDFYEDPRIQARITRACIAWEKWAFSHRMVQLYDWLSRLLPHAEMWWHNEPGHLSPGDGTEEERGVWEALVPFRLKGLLLQGWPPDAGLGVQNVAYDLWDMRRRFRGEHSPWGGPILGLDGKPLACVPLEFSAHSIYNDGYPESIATEWATELVKAEPCDCLDGIPK